jgi:hypothetical protein
MIIDFQWEINHAKQEHKQNEIKLTQTKSRNHLG